eukprot:1160516-Pelagomonas_calceolata.AAC.3
MTSPGYVGGEVFQPQELTGHVPARSFKTKEATENNVRSVGIYIEASAMQPCYMYNSLLNQPW